VCAREEKSEDYNGVTILIWDYKGKARIKCVRLFSLKTINGVMLVESKGVVPQPLLCDEMAQFTNPIMFKRSGD
jgi:hypothetical protein